MAQGDPASTSKKVLLDAIKHLVDRMGEQMSSMKHELTQERECTDEHLIKCMNLEKALSFKKKSHKVQYHLSEKSGANLRPSKWL